MNEATISLVKLAKQKSIEVRRKAKHDLNTPICIYSLCEKLKVKVRFTPINIEGMYVIQDKTPLILVSSLRPLVRRNFTCAHELGHHIFKHGSKIDSLITTAQKATYHSEEFLVDSFAGFMLMPTIGIRKAFSIRNWNIKIASPEQFYTIACNFGVGYETLVKHMAYSLNEISHQKANSLLKYSPKKIRKDILLYETHEPLVIIDKNWSKPTVDVEIGSHILLPNFIKTDNKKIVLIEKYTENNLFKVIKSGILSVYGSNGFAVFIRVSKKRFQGLSEYRHLDDDDNQ